MYLKEESMREVKVKRNSRMLHFDRGVCEVDDEWAKQLIAQGGFEEINVKEFNEARTVQLAAPEKKKKGTFTKLPELAKNKGDD